MPWPRRLAAGFAGTLVIAVLTGHAGATASGPQRTPPVATNQDDAAIEAFLKRVDEYVALHRRLEAKIPKVPENPTPQQVDQAQRGLLKALQAARAGASPGDLFTPEMTAFIKRLMADVFGGPGGARLRASMMDENVKELPLKVNQRFPDEIPLATMPPRLLKGLPELPEQMEFRFVASQFVLLDTHAHLVVDFIPNALPGR